MLNIQKVAVRHIGCYVVTIDNGVGPRRTQRGYLDITPTQHNHSSEREFHVEIGLPLLISLGILVVLLVSLVLGAHRWGKLHRTSSTISNVTENLLKKNIYISHCVREARHKKLLLEFASALSSSNTNVTIDICNLVDVNNTGGLQRWMRSKIENADTIIIIVTPSYMEELQMMSNQQPYAPPLKVCAELKLIEQVKKEVLVVCLDVEDVPTKLKHFKKVQFPHAINLVQNPDFQQVFVV